jgi:hypothetical protein
MERFNLKKLHEVESEERYRVEASDWDAEADINRAWETLRENTQISAKESLGYCELKKH